jgi:rhamnulokinase
VTVDVVAAVDLGATSGRVMLGAFDRGELSLTQVARFRNGPVRVHDSLHWDILGLYQDIVAGLGAAVRRLPEVRSVGVDSWAIDYGLFRNGALLGNPHHYRDDRNPPAAESVAADVSPDEQYQRNGLQFLPFNTIYQLRADAMADQLELADRLLMIPDLISYWLSGVAVTELTNASTTGLLSVHEPVWDEELIERLGYPRRLFTELVAPGTELGGLLPSVTSEIGKQLRVIAVG